jgi:diaminohydroxyphosphoribosylaminopyrimidine deaminase/5-amino-6-(5-phosphoribosylamino)uracil reductase
MTGKSDSFFMQRALALAARGAGFVSPNPMVGCVIVKKNKIISEGYHKKFGGDHAEVAALKKLKERANGATLYVTLEPCHHVGKTPPCVDAVIASGVKRVVLAMKDPNPLTAGKSIRKMKRAGITVTVGVLVAEAKELNRAFCKWIQCKMPYVIVKIAQSLDGKIAPAKAQQAWITGDIARKEVHKMRAAADAVLVGRGTAVTDDPQLTARLVKTKSSQPKRVILDSKLRISPKAKIFNTPGGDILLFCSLPHEHAKVKAFNKLGLRIFCGPADKEGGLDLIWVLSQLGVLGVVRLLVEGGSHIFTSFLKQNLADEWIFHVAPKFLGPKAVPAFRVSQKTALFAKFTESKMLGRDLMLRRVIT